MIHERSPFIHAKGPGIVTLASNHQIAVPRRHIARTVTITNVMMLKC